MSTSRNFVNDEFPSPDSGVALDINIGSDNLPITNMAGV